MPKSLSVLIVEDEWLIASDYVSIIRRAGHVVVGPAATGAAAIRLIDTAEVQVALLDYQLANETSAAVAIQLRDRKIPFAFLTGHSQKDIASDLGYAALVSKPVEGGDIPGLLLQLVDAAY
ncbi:MAG: response regulator [Devosia sp.]|nr:response regulator [Devosia sp.]